MAQLSPTEHEEALEAHDEAERLQDAIYDLDVEISARLGQTVDELRTNLASRQALVDALEQMGYEL